MTIVTQTSAIQKGREKVEFQKRFNELITDPLFLELKSLKSNKTIFEIVAASHTEMWHSAFISWVLDPTSNLGLGNFPLQRFLYMVRYENNFNFMDSSLESLGLVEIEDPEIYEGMEFVTEKAAGNLRLDIIGNNKNVLRITIENKIKAKESADQTKKYNEYLEQTNSYEYDVKVYLTPNENDKPESNDFIPVTYQKLCDFVLKPILKHPSIREENKYLVNQYVNNLGKPINTQKGGVMAMPNKEICEKLYETHKEVLDEIYAVLDRKPPVKKTKTMTHYNISLTQLMDAGLLSMKDRLIITHYNTDYEASFVQENDQIKIEYKGEKYNSPSTPGAMIKGRQTNGWREWSVYDQNNERKGSLLDIRDIYLQEVVDE
ncbi:PD-(D/E)XK nuclease family protein [Sporosarcina sp. FSL W8-0480]|uniref:PD-(D/E)XK nuclease family protein n=1 Tax=Sporosarcina sp. FSL W8-0480 TaxID=2954701 RepID=UPI0030DBB80F